MISRGLKNFPLLALLAAGLSACANYAGDGLRPGASREQVLAVMGKPAMEWTDPDGSRQLAYPRGPEGQHTIMVYLAPDGRMLGLENALEPRHFARLIPGRSTQADVLRILGPSVPQWTVYFGARDELVWEWLYCDDAGKQARLDVLFNGINGPVRTSFSRPDYQGPDGLVPRCGRLVLPGG